MTTITTLDRPTLRFITQDIQHALAPIALKYDVELRYTSANYNRTSAKITLELAVKKDGNPATPDASAYLTYCLANKTDPAALYGTFHTHKGTFKLVGLKPRSPKYPYVIENTETGERRKATRDYMQLYYPEMFT